MKDFSGFIGREIPPGWRFCCCYCMVVKVEGRDYYAQFAPDKGAWGNFCFSLSLQERVQGLVPERPYIIITVPVLVNSETHQAFSLMCVVKALMYDTTAGPLHYVTEAIIPSDNPTQCFRWEPGTPPPAKPFVATTTSPAFVLSSGTRGA